HDGVGRLGPERRRAPGRGRDGARAHRAARGGAGVFWGGTVMGQTGGHPPTPPPGGHPLAPLVAPSRFPLVEAPGRPARPEAVLREVLVGQPGAVRGVLIALLAGGPVLLEGPPGLGKTLLVQALSRLLALSFRRIAFTPDLMPADILGTQVLGARG